MTHEPDDPKDAPAEDAESEEDREAIARRLAEVLGAGPGVTPPEDPDGPDRPRGRLRLDKSGVLAETPRLEPRRPYGKTGREVPGPEGSEPLREQAGSREPRKATIPPPLGAFRPADLHGGEEIPPDDEVMVSSGSFLYGENCDAHEVPGFRIDRFPVTNAEYELFVRSTGHRAPLYWPDGQPPEELGDHPVVGVDYFDALAYARWRGKDLPFEDEWERAARGTDGRTYPWGNEPELGEANTARMAHKMTLPVGWHALNVSPDGAQDMVGNVWEITHSPAPGGGVVVRGGSWYDFVLYAKNWFRFASRADARNGTIGFRCVRRERERPDAKREIPASEVDAAIAARQGIQPTPDPSTFSPERRDLVPDYRRLSQLIEERKEEEGEGPAGPGPLPPMHRRGPASATPSPPVTRMPKPRAPEPPPEKEPPAAPPPEEPPVVPPAVSVDEAPGIDRSGLSHAADMATKGAVATREEPSGPSEPGTPLLYWALLGAGVILVGVLLIVIISGLIGGEEPDIEDLSADNGSADPDMPDPVPFGTVVEHLPPATPGDPRDSGPPRVIDGLEAGWDEPLEQGVWLLVFVDPNQPASEASKRTARAASNLHQRMRDLGARLLLVFPRSAFVAENGRLEPEESRRELLYFYGANYDIQLLLDAPVGPPLGGALRTRHRVRSPIAAVVTVDGVIEHHLVPLEGGFTTTTLEPLAVRATQIRPVVKTPPDEE